VHKRFFSLTNKCARARLVTFRRSLCWNHFGCPSGTCMPTANILDDNYGIPYTALSHDVKTLSITARAS